MDKTPQGRRHSVPHIHMHGVGGGGNTGPSGRPRPTIIAPKGEKSRGSSSLISPIRTTKLASPKDGIFKLPPRSRTGCWTCRTRKVKCGEEHPVCTQCSRLNHQCDYHPRLSFRDDTRRIVDRMPEVTTRGSVVWDPSARGRRGSIVEPLSATTPTLPPFHKLTNDEDREIKALSRIPGTYVRVYNPQSFQASAEQNDEEAEGKGKGKAKEPPSPVVTKIKQEEQDDQDLETEALAKTVKDIIIASSEATASDPDVVIAGRFDEPNLKVPSSLSLRAQLSPLTNELDHSSPSPSRSPVSIKSLKEEPTTKDLLTLPLYHPESAQASASDDSINFYYYQEVVAPHVFQIRGVGNIWTPLVPGSDFFEAEANQFRPLYHAMMAVSAFSLEHKNQRNFIQSLQHYQTALPALQSSLSSPVDLTSDGILYTHFFLLLYEIAAAEAGRPNLWLHHLTQLRNLLFERSLLQTTGATPFIIWYLVTIDVVTSLAGVGEGELTASFLRNNLVTDFKNIFKSNPNGDGMKIIPNISHQSLENEAFLQALALNQQLILLGSTIAKARVALKVAAQATVNFVTDDTAPTPEIQASVREAQVQDILGELLRIWIFHQSGMQNLATDGNNIPSNRLMVLQSQATVFYHALTLYARTSMWPQQVHETADVDLNNTEITLSVSAIITESARALSQTHVFMSTGFLVFPLFMAGIASTDVSDKVWVLDTLTRAGDHTVGRNCSVIKAALQTVYQQQNAATMLGSTSSSVVWQDILCEFGVQVALFGF